MKGSGFISLSRAMFRGFVRDRVALVFSILLPILAFAAMTSRYHSPRVRNAVHVPQIEFFDITNIWLDR